VEGWMTGINRNVGGKTERIFGPLLG